MQLKIKLFELTLIEKFIIMLVNIILDKDFYPLKINLDNPIELLLDLKYIHTPIYDLYPIDLLSIKEIRVLSVYISSLVY